MRMTRPFLLATAASLAALFAASTIAEAQTRRAHSRPLTVKKRSFLDAGKVVPVGSQSGYVQAGHYFNRTPDYYMNRGRYGGETLPGRFDLPGGRPLFTF